MEGPLNSLYTLRRSDELSDNNEVIKRELIKLDQKAVSDIDAEEEVVFDEFQCSVRSIATSFIREVSYVKKTIFCKKYHFLKRKVKNIEDRNRKMQSIIKEKERIIEEYKMREYDLEKENEKLKNVIKMERKEFVMVFNDISRKGVKICRERDYSNVRNKYLEKEKEELSKRLSLAEYQRDVAVFNN